MIVSAPEPLAPDHDIEGFECGEPALDVWLKRRAKANQVSGASRTFVVRDASVVVAYYALASSAIDVASATGRFRRNIPDPIPVVVLARLAVARSHQGRGFGPALVQDAARRVVQAADAIGIRGFIAHAISDEARTFYLRLGFDPSPVDAMTLMTTLADLRASLP